jgi:FkbM family methyltransferase
MILDTSRLFLRLLRTFEIATVCDVGSMDGSDALLFRRALPTADILALEPNPRNFVRMEADEALRRRSIRILPFAASDRESEAPFFVVKADYATDRDLTRRGMSSLHCRSDRSQLAEVVQVRTARLDRLLSAQSVANGPIAFWVDTEGMAFEAISGASGVLGATQMLHVEVETAPCIGESQKLFADVERLLADAGFAAFATDQSRDALQFNVLFIRTDTLRTRAAEISRDAERQRLHTNARRAVARVLPRRVRGLLRFALAQTRRW